MKSLIILISKILYMIGKLIGKGSSMPGKIALKLDKNILKKIALPDDIVVVTGSNGKKYPVRIIQSGHRHKKQILYDLSSKVYAIEAGSFLKNEMNGKPQMVQGQVGKNGIVTLL